MNGSRAGSTAPPGGIIRFDDQGEPNGVLEENAFFAVLVPVLGGLGDEGLKAFARAGAGLWARFGYTTAQEGRSSAQIVNALKDVAAKGDLPIDVVAYPDVLVDRDFIAESLPILGPIMFFVAVLVIGLVYEIKKGGLEWEK